MTKRNRIQIGALIVAAVAALAAAVLAAGPMLAPSPPRVYDIEIKPVTNVAGEFVAVPITAKIHVVEYMPSGEVNSHEVGSVQFDLSKTNGTIVIDGESYDDREIMDGLAAIVLREWRKANPDALPVRRALRKQRK